MASVLEGASREDAARQTGRLARQTGRLRFTVEQNGRVADDRLREGTGHTLLDRVAVTMIERAQRLPAIFRALQLRRPAVVVAISFALA